MREFIVLACVAAFAASSPGCARGQDASHISVAAGAHGLTLPWHPGPVWNRFNPAVMVGTDHDWKSAASWRLFYAVNLSLLRHHWWMTGIAIEPELGLGGSFPGGLYADVRLGLGYMHYFWRRQRLELENGQWVEASDLGRPSLTVPLSATLGYQGDRSDPVTVAPFVSARWSAQVVLIEEAAVLSHLQFLAGVRIKRPLGIQHEGR